MLLGKIYSNSLSRSANTDFLKHSQQIIQLIYSGILIQIRYPSNKNVYGIY